MTRIYEICLVEENGKNRIVVYAALDGQGKLDDQVAMKLLLQASRDGENWCGEVRNGRVIWSDPAGGECETDLFTAAVRAGAQIAIHRNEGRSIYRILRMTPLP
jgi:hypothetical protein